MNGIVIIAMQSNVCVLFRKSFNAYDASGVGEIKAPPPSPNKHSSTLYNIDLMYLIFLHLRHNVVACAMRVR